MANICRYLYLKEKMNNHSWPSSFLLASFFTTRKCIYVTKQLCFELKVASSDLVNMGISVVSYTIKDIRDDEVTNI